MAALVTDLAQLLNGIPAGAWVAISARRNQTIAYGDDARSVLNEARGKGEQFPLMVRVPQTDLAIAA